MRLVTIPKKYLSRHVTITKLYPIKPTGNLQHSFEIRSHNILIG